MKESAMSESGIFKAAVKLRPDQRAGYLDHACGVNRELRSEVESLLRAHDASGGILQNFPARPEPTEGFDPIVERPGTVIGPYKLMELVGEGGFGLVFVAEQQEPVRRKVALKIIKPGMDTREVIARFEAERQALALMDHPNIARVLDAGTTDSGRPYFVMELVKGIPIIDYCDQQQLSTRERLELFVSVCQAVQHAHGKGIIHRDLKPSNILVAPHDGVPVVKVIDFGVAKAIGQQLTDKTIYTRLTQMIGTPLYMSPEQAEINALDVDTRSDIYSLGVLLYELLTGATPFDRQRFATAAYDEIRRIIKEEEPPKPSTRLSTMGESLSKVSSQRKTEPAKLSALVKGDLDWIVMKALEKDRKRRYDTASSFAADVRRFLAEEPIEARPPSAWYRFRKFARRNKAVLATTGIVVAALLVGTTASVLQAVRATLAETLATERLDLALSNENKARESERAAEGERDKAKKSEKAAQTQRDAANAARVELRSSLYQATMNLVPTAWETGNVKRVLELLDEASPKPGEKEDLRNFEWHYWDRLCHAERRSLPPIDAVGTKVVFSGDGKRFVYYKGRNDAEQAGAGVMMVDGKRILVYKDKNEKVKDRIMRLQRGTMVIQVVDTAQGRPVGPERKCAVGSDFALNQDGSRLAYITPDPAGGRDPNKPKQNNVLAVMDLATGKDTVLCQGFVTSVLNDSRLTFSPDGKRLAAFGAIGPGAGAESKVHVWDLTQPDREPVVLALEKGFRDVSLDFNFDGSRLAAVLSGFGFQSPKTRIIVWDTTAGKIRAQLTPEFKVRHITFTRDGKQLIGIGTAEVPRVAKDAPHTYLWEGAAGDELKLVRQTLLPSLDFGTNYLHLALSPDGRRLVISRPVGHGLRIIDVNTGEVRQSIKTIEGVSAAAFSSDDSRLWVAEATLVPQKGTTLMLKEWDVEPDRPPPGRPLAAERARQVILWSKDGTRQAVYQRPPPGLLRPSALPDKKQQEGPVISIRDKDGKEIHQFREHTRPVPGTSVQFSPNGRFVLSQAGSQAMVWETDTGKIHWRRDYLFLPTLMGKLHSPDLRFLVLTDDATRANYKIVRFDDLGELFRVGPAYGIVFSPDSRRLVTHGPDGMRLWDLEAGRAILANSSPGRTTTVFSSDSRWFATGRLGVTVFDAATGKKRAELKEGMGRLFTPRNIVFSPDGSRLAALGTASPYLESLTTTIHDLTTGKLVCRLEGNRSPVTHLAFSPDGKRIATAMGNPGEKGEVKLWDATTGRELLSLSRTGAVAAGLAFSTDGHRLTLRQSGVETTWDATPRKKGVEPARR
jgi:serine/threonine protein kinase/WD40 repeat protein